MRASRVDVARRASGAQFRFVRQGFGIQGRAGVRAAELGGDVRRDAAARERNRATVGPTRAEADRRGNAETIADEESLYRLESKHGFQDYGRRLFAARQDAPAVCFGARALG